MSNNEKKIIKIDYNRFCFNADQDEEGYRYAAEKVEEMRRHFVAANMVEVRNVILRELSKISFDSVIEEGRDHRVRWLRLELHGDFADIVFYSGLVGNEEHDDFFGSEDSFFANDPGDWIDLEFDLISALYRYDSLVAHVVEDIDERIGATLLNPRLREPVEQSHLNWGYSRYVIVKHVTSSIPVLQQLDFLGRGDDLAKCKTMADMLRDEAVEAIVNGNESYHIDPGYKKEGKECTGNQVYLTSFEYYSRTVRATVDIFVVDTSKLDTAEGP